MLINFISNLPKGLRTGGFSAMNFAACEALEAEFAVHYAGPIDLASPAWPRLASQALRLAGLPGAYFQYSTAQLARFAADASERCDPAAGLDFFHGFTPWIGDRPVRPYVAWSDCTFRDYSIHYNRREQFHAADLARIERQEAEWLRSARAVGFTSDWAAQRAIADYGLDPAKVSVVGIFGEAALPESDTYGGAPQFAFISTNFVAKGGAIVMAAFRQLRMRHPAASLVVVGDVPCNLVAEPGVEIAGFLSKEDPQDNLRLRCILARSRAVVLPTKSDIAPLLLVEATYFGCPVIATRRFAIGEIVEHGATGLLVDDPDDVGGIARAMALLLECDDAQYRSMRLTAWKRGREHLSRARFAARLRAMVQSATGHKP